MSAAATTELTALPRSPSLPTFFDNLDSFAAAPEGVAKLRAFVLDLAVRGKLVEQDENDEPASALLERVEAEKTRLVQAGSLKKSKPSPPIDDVHSNGVPSGWSAVRLGSCIELISGQHLKPDEYNEEGDGHPYLTGPADFGDLHPTATRWTHEERAIAIEGDILVTVKGAGIGKTNVLATPTAFISRQLMAVRPILLDRDFVRLVLLHTYDKFQSQGVGIAIPGIGRDDILNHVFWLPPLSEQRRIVLKVDGLMSLCDELESRGSQRVRLRERASRSCLDRLVSSRSHGASENTEDLSSAWQRLSDHFEVLYDTPETLAHLHQSILRLAVQGRLVPQDPNDEAAAKLHARLAKERERYSLEHGMKTKATEKNGDGKPPWRAPPGWIWTRLSTLFNVVTDGDHLPPPKTEDGIAFLTIGNVTTGELNFADCRYVPEDYYDKLKPFRKPKRGDILYTVVGATYGRPAIVETDRPFCVQRHIAILKPASEIDVSFLKSLLASPFIYDQATRNTSGTAQPTVALGPLREFLVPLPPLAEQKRIVAKVDQLLSQCDELSARLRERQSATQQLLTANIHYLFFAAIGLFGGVVSFGLYCYELRGIVTCILLDRCGKSLEQQLNLEQSPSVRGAFSVMQRPPRLLRYATSTFAGSLVYSAVIAGWGYVFSLAFVPDAWTITAIVRCVTIPLGVFVLSMVAAVCISKHYRSDQE